MSPNADRGCLTGVRVCAISSVRSVAFLSPLTTCPPPQNSLRMGGKNIVTLLHSRQVEFTVNISCGGGAQNNRVCQPDCDKEMCRTFGRGMETFLLLRKCVNAANQKTSAA